MATNKLSELRKLSTDLKNKKKVEEAKKKSSVVQEHNKLINGALGKKQQMEKTIKPVKDKTGSSVSFGKPILLIILIFMLPTLLTVIFFSNHQQPRKISVPTQVTKIELQVESRDYSKISRYVEGIINLAASKKLDEINETIWHRNAAPEARYYSTLRLQEMPSSEAPAINKIYHYPDCNCFSCICSQKQSRHNLVFKVAPEDDKLKLVAIE